VPLTIQRTTAEPRPMLRWLLDQWLFGVSDPNAGGHTTQSTHMAWAPLQRPHMFWFTPLRAPLEQGLGMASYPESASSSFKLGLLSSGFGLTCHNHLTKVLDVE
jgi:hypothetical protein